MNTLEGSLKGQQTDLLAAIVTSSSDAIVTVGIDDAVMSWNPRAAELFGHSEAGALGRLLSELIVPESLYLETQMLVDAVRLGGQGITRETSRRLANGRLAPFEIAACSVRSRLDTLSAISISYREISERRTVTTDLRANQLALQAALDVANMATWGWDAVDGAQLWTAKTKALFGLSPDTEVTKSAFIKLLHPDDVARHEVAWASAIDPRGNRVYDLEYRIHRANDGVERFISSKATADFDDDRIVRVLGVLRDCTEEHHGREQLFREEARHKLGFAIAGLGLCMVDYELGRTVLDTTAATLLALPANTPLPNSQVHSRFHPDDAEHISSGYAKTLDPAGAGFLAIDHRIVRPDGVVRWVSARLQVKFAPNRGGTWRATDGLLALLDITDRKLEEQRVLISEIRYRRLFEAAQDGVLLLDPVSCKITEANPFMTRLLGYAHDQLVGKELFEIGLLKDAVASREMFEKLKSTHHVRYENLPLESQTGQHQNVEVVANVYDEAGRSVIQCNIRDITERKRPEEHNKLLMGEVNHRAKNLLAVIQSVAHQTARDGDPATFVARLSDRISGLAASQDLLVENQWNGVALSDLVAAQLAHFKDLMGQRIRLDGPPVLLTPAAAQGIGMALHELATNAAKYGALSNATGRVHVAWNFTAADKETFSMSWREEGGPAVIPPGRGGFGQMVIGKMVEAAVDGKAEIVYAEGGLAWTLTAPTEDILEIARTIPRLTDASSEK